MEVKLFSVLILFFFVSFCYSDDTTLSSIEGVVYERETGLPVPGAVIATKDGKVTVTDIGGGYKIKSLKNRKYTLYCFVTGYSSFEENVTIIDKRTIKVIPLHKENISIFSQDNVKNSIILGSVIDSVDSTAISGAEISLTPGNNVISTDENGMFSFVSELNQKYKVIVSHNDYHTQQDEMLLVANNFFSQLHIALVPKILPSDTSGSILINIADMSSETSIQDAAISLIGTNYQVNTDSSGNYFFPLVPRGSYKLIVYKKGYNSNISNITISPHDTASISVKLEKSSLSEHAFFRGLITDNNGLPISGAEISIGNKRFLTDNYGAFFIDTLTPGLIALEIKKENYLTRHDSLFVSPGLETFSTFTLNSSLSGSSENISKDRKRCTIKGSVTDQKSSTGITGATIQVIKRDFFAITDASGNFLLTNLPKGKYKLQISNSGYETSFADSLSVNPDSESIVNVQLKPLDVKELVKLTVSTRKVKNTAGSLIEQRKTALTISDGVAYQDISKINASNAADAIKLVTGVTLVDDRYPIIRGLSERYNMTMLNGVELPSPDPERRAVALDLFPSNLLDNIEVWKTFNTENWGNFSGGIVNIVTKDFPEKRSLSLSVKSSYNYNTTFRKDFLTDEGGSLDWLGIDDGTRALPQAVNQRSPWTPDETIIRRIKMSNLPDSVKTDSIVKVINRINEVSHAFKNNFEPDRKTAIPDLGTLISYGETFMQDDNLKLGLFFSLSYDNKNQTYRDGMEAEWIQNSHYDSSSSELDYNIINTFQKSKNEVLWGGLGRIGLSLFEDHKFYATSLFTCNTDETAREITSQFDEQIRDTGSQFVKKEIKYQERRLIFSLLNGEHKLFSNNIFTILWNVGYTRSLLNEPDIRSFLYFRNTITTPPQYGFMTGTYDPEHLFRKVTENTANSNIDFKFILPFNFAFSNDSASIKFGGALQLKDRDFYQNKFKVVYSSPSKTLQDVIGNFDDYTDQSNMGILERIPGSTDSIGNQILKTGVESDTSNNYNGYQDIFAGYASLSLPITDWFTISGGIRYENISLKLMSWNPNDTNTNIQKRDEILLPSVSTIFSLNSMKFRLNYGRTYAKPVYREITRSFITDISLKSVETGNPDLVFSDIHNFDIRWDWFFNAGELFSASGFYKFIINPITKNYVSSENRIIQIINQDSAKVYGLEFEIRKRFGFIHPELENLSASGNFTLLYTETQADTMKEKWLKQYYSQPELKIPLYGASPYVINFALLYENQILGLNSAVYFNAFGKSLDYISNASPDIYIYPYPLLNYTLEKSLGKHIKIKISAKNLLLSKVKEGLTYKGNEYIRRTYNKGSTYSINFSFKF